MNQTKDRGIVPILTGDIFLRDRIVDETKCYICGKVFNKFEDKDMLLVRLRAGELAFCCPTHRGVLQEFMRQYKTLPGGWIRTYEKYIEDSGGNIGPVDCLSRAIDGTVTST